MHKIVKTGLTAGMTALAMLLAACHDDDGGSAPADSGQPVPLASKDDVLREFGNLGSVLVFQLEPFGLGQASGEPSAGAASPAAMLARLRGQRALLAAQRANASLNSACSGGGNDQRTSDSKSRSFGFFQFTGTVSYTLDLYSNCAVPQDDGLTDTSNGSVEIGATADDAYRYAVLGSGTSSVHIIENGNGATIDQGLLGTAEVHTVANQSDDVKAHLQVDVARQGGTAGSEASLTLGNADLPFDVTIVTSGSSFNGPYSYKGSGACGGGDVTVATPSVLTIDSSTGVFNGGTLSFSSGGKSVTLSFGTDGNTTLSGDVTGTIASKELNQAFVTFPCLSVLSN